MPSENITKLLDIDLLDDLLAKHYRATGVPVGVFDARGNPILSAGMKKICTKFHKASEESASLCAQSQEELKDITPEEEYREYICPHGLRNIGIPIKLDGKIIAIMKFGQFFYEDEIPDKQLFEQNAARFGFGKEEYLEALNEVPSFGRQHIANIIDYYISIVHIIVNLAEKNKELEEKRRIKEDYEQRISETNKKFRLITENSDDVIWTVDKNLDISYVSPSVETILGYSPIEFKSLAFDEFLDGKYLEDVIASFRNIAENPDNPRHQFPDIFEIKHIKKDGEKIWCELVIKALFNSKGQLEGMLSISREIQIRKSIEQSLRNNLSFLQTLIDNIPNPIFYKDADLNYTGCNRAFEKFIGLERKKIIGRNVFELFDQDLANIYDRADRDLLAEGGNQVYDAKARRADGEIRDVRYYKATYLNDEGEKGGIVGILIDITDQKNMVEELRNSEERFKILFEYAPDAYYMNDLKGRFIDGNLAAEKLIGLKRSELIGKNMLELNLMPKKFLPLAAANLARALLGVQTGPDEFVLNRQNGSHVQVEISTYPVKINNRTVVLGIARDITERKQAEEALRQSEQKYRTLFETAAEGIMTISYPDGKIVDINDSALKMIDYKRKEMHTLTADDFVNITDIESLKNDFDRQIREHDYFAKEMKWITKSGKVFPVAVSAKMFTMYNKPMVQLIARDITRQKQAEKAMRESEQKYRATVEQSAEGIYIMDIESRKIIESNLTLQNLLGYSSGELIGKPVYDIISHPKDDIDWHIDRVIENKQLKIDERKYRRKDGSTIDVEVSGSIITYSGKTALLVVSRDITERKIAEQELKKLVEDLRVSNETIEKNANELIALNEKLSESEEKLQDLNARKDKFFSIIAHDLKSPFQGFLLLSKGLSMQIDSMPREEINEVARDMYVSAKNLFKLLENLLLWSRLQRRTIETEPDYFQLNEIVVDNIELFSQQAQNKSINLENRVDNEAFVYADMKMIDTIIRNLISNAIKFTPEGGTLEISAKNMGTKTEISVSDSGVGIEPERITNLFRIGENTSTFGTGNEKGTGIGLALCKELVEKNGGEIYVESTVGKGTSFRFTLPSIIQE
jgi:PAS domain S-box-containing protein